MFTSCSSYPGRPRQAALLTHAPARSVLPQSTSVLLNPHNGSLRKRLCSIQRGLCRREESGGVRADATATCRPAARKEAVFGMSCFLHPPFRAAERREGEMGEEVSGGGNLLVLSCDTHAGSGQAAPWGRSGGDGAVAQSWANLSSGAPPAARDARGG